MSYITCAGHAGARFLRQKVGDISHGKWALEGSAGEREWTVRCWLGAPMPLSPWSSAPQSPLVRCNRLSNSSCVFSAEFLSGQHREDISVRKLSTASNRNHSPQRFHNLEFFGLHRTRSPETQCFQQLDHITKDLSPFPVSVLKSRMYELSSGQLPSWPQGACQY